MIKNCNLSHIDSNNIFELKFLQFHFAILTLFLFKKFFLKESLLNDDLILRNLEFLWIRQRNKKFNLISNICCNEICKNVFLYFIILFQQCRQEYFKSRKGSGRIIYGLHKRRSRCVWNILFTCRLQERCASTK